jgi:hypothetical protein
MRNMDRALLSGLMIVGLGWGIDAEACSTDGWLGGIGNIPANAEAASPPSVARYSEFCALSVDGEAFVQSDFANDTRYRARFYVFDGLSGSGAIDIFEAYGDENDEANSALFKIAFDGTQFTFDATDATGTSTTAASVNGWNLVEFDWNSDAGTFDFWVNADATTDAATGSVDAGTGTVDAVRLGAPNGFGTQAGNVNFDAFESHRTTPVGPLLAGDSNGNESVNIFDMIGIQNEILDPVNSLAAGQPDCNGNGSVNVFDMICVQNIILSGN